MSVLESVGCACKNGSTRPSRLTSTPGRIRERPASASAALPCAGNLAAASFATAIGLSNVRGWQAPAPIYSEDLHMSGLLAQRRGRLASLIASPPVPPALLAVRRPRRLRAIHRGGLAM